MASRQAKPMKKFRTLHFASFWQSLQVRMTLLTFGVILASLWSLALYVGSETRSDLQRLLSEQQRAHVSTHAEELERAISERMNALEQNSHLNTFFNINIYL